MRSVLALFLASVTISLFCYNSSAQERAQRFPAIPPSARSPISETGREAETRRPIAPNPWSQMAKLTSAQTLWFGESISVSGDTLVVGDSRFDISINGSAAYVFVKPNSGWINMVHTAILTPSDRASFFANSVSISGDTIAIGAPGAGNGVGAVYVYVKPATGWTNMTETARLTASDGGDLLGSSVSLNRGTIVAGAPGSSAQGLGSAYVFVEPQSGWKSMTQTAKLTSSDGAGGDNFGQSVSLSGDTVVAGAPQVLTGNGKGYVFVRPANGWTNMTETAELTASNGEFQQDFGWAAAIDGNTVVFSEPSGYGVYVFVKPQSGWKDMTQTAELTAKGSSFWFGYSVAVQGDEVLVGDYLYWVNPNFLDEGGALLYVKPNSGWQNSSAPQATLTGSDARLGSFFGSAVSISGNTIVSGASGVGNGENFFVGGAYVFKRP